eukprot:COSAG02_NODE_54_length_43941_cov_54.857990_41_plen_64_part_00
MAVPKCDDFNVISMTDIILCYAIPCKKVYFECIANEIMCTTFWQSLLMARESCLPHSVLQQWP